MARLRDWNRAHSEGPVDFLTQVSIDAARDDELLGLCREAGLRRVFIGIESPNEDSLRETKKRQNLRFDLASQVERFLDHGISVTAGMIVGFDADGPDIFARQLEFATALPVPIFTVGALVAPPATPLYERLRRSGRLTADGSEVAATPWSTNIVPQRMDRTALLEGLRWLCRSLYEPAAFSERILRFIARIASAPRSPSLGGSFASRALRPVEVDTLKLLSRLPRLGPAEEAMWIAIRARLARAPAAADLVFPMLLQYLQIRHMYAVAGLWDLDQRGDSRRDCVEIPAAI